MKLKRIKRIAFVLLLMYVFSYLGLSRISEYIHRDLYSNPNSQFEFYYVPFREEQIVEHPKTLGTIHAVLIPVYYPVWLIDYYVLKGLHYAQYPSTMRVN